MEQTTHITRSGETATWRREDRSWLEALGSAPVRWFLVLQRIGAFTLITLGVLLGKWHVAHRVIFPIIRQQIARAGVQLLPIVGLMGVALGFILIGQLVSLLVNLGATNLSGALMTTIVIREIGPITAALLVLARVGAATVIELGTARAMGEVEALEALGIDPIHYLVIPRLIGLTAAIFALSIYLILIALVSGLGFAILQELPLPALDYWRQIALALRWQDFPLLTLKTFGYGIVLSLIICYHGLAQPLGLADVATATTRAVAQGVIACVLIDAFFLVVYFVW